jgi:hypothetical protein
VKVIVFLVCGAAVAIAQQPPTLEARPLHESSSKLLSVPGFSSFGWSQCDADGNLYFRIGQELNKTAILRIGPDGSNHDLYTLPSEYADDTAYLQFRITPDGEIHVLVQHRDSSYLVFSFERDSTTVASRTHLEMPEHGQHRTSR